MGFKEADRLAPDPAKKTCVALSRTKTVSKKSRICCQDFKSKCEMANPLDPKGDCYKTYDKGKREKHYQAKRAQCNAEKKKCVEREKDVVGITRLSRV